MSLRTTLTIGYLVVLAIFWTMWVNITPRAWWSVAVALMFTIWGLALMIRMRRKLTVAPPT